MPTKTTSTSAAITPVRYHLPSGAFLYHTPLSQMSLTLPLLTRLPRSRSKRRYPPPLLDRQKHRRLPQRHASAVRPAQLRSVRHDYGTFGEPGRWFVSSLLRFTLQKVSREGRLITVFCYVAWNFVRINELVFDAGYGSTDGFFFNASGLQWEGRGAGVFVGWLGM